MKHNHAHLFTYYLWPLLYYSSRVELQQTLWLKMPNLPSPVLD